MKKDKKVDKIKLGIIGNPLEHTMSPKIHNFICNTLKIKCDYNVCQIEEDQIENFIEFAKAENFSGFNITIPYKQKTMKYIDYIDPFAKKCDAVNTVSIKDNKLFGYNTDGEGFYLSLLNKNISVLDKDISVIGCGGAAFGIAQKLLDEKCRSINIFCRDILKAENLIKKDNKKIKAYSMQKDILKDLISKSDILINTTPLGMKNFKDDFREFSFLDNFNGVLCDIVYNPILTKLLYQGKNRGIITVDGLNMLVNQGILSFEKFSGLELDKKVLSDLLYKEIKKYL